jgi:aspartyl-tRNA(Asn)/glutamyl-tRNA(Gln) amidotransferase subunit C
VTTLTEQDVKKIAHLARLEIKATEIPKHVANLSKILDFVEQINSVNTKNIEPIAHPLDGNSRMREDVITETDQREICQSIAPEIEEGLYLVPKVIEACAIEKP